MAIGVGSGGHWANYRALPSGSKKSSQTEKETNSADP